MNAQVATHAVDGQMPVKTARRAPPVSRAQQLRAMFRLASYLGPWRDSEVAPPDVQTRDVLLEVGAPSGGPLRARLYSPAQRRPIGSYLLAHGLNPSGPFDVRCDRFARVLAHAGFVVMSPELVEYRQLLMTPEVATTFATAARQFVSTASAAPWGRPGIFGISFGAYPALAVAGSPELAHHFGGVVTFGGYGAFHRTLRFALGVRDERANHNAVDDTCLPAVFLNLLPKLMPHLDPVDQAQVARGIRDFVAQTWGKAALKSRCHTLPIAARIAERLDDEPARVFRTAVGLQAGGIAACLAGLSQHDEAELDPRPAMANIQCPVYLLHAADDDVIPCDQIDALAAAVPQRVAVERYLTGLYDHGGQAGRDRWLDTGCTAVRECITMCGMLRAIVRGGIDRAAPPHPPPSTVPALT